MDRQTYSQTDRQTYKWQMGGPIDGWMNGLTDRWTDEQFDRCTDRHMDRWTYWNMDILTDGQINRGTDRLTDINASIIGKILRCVLFCLFCFKLLSLRYKNRHKTLDRERGAAWHGPLYESHFTFKILLD